MTAGTVSSAALSLNPADLYELQDAASGATWARIVEVARVRTPRGSFLLPERVQTPRLTFALTSPDGMTLMYADRAEHRKRNLIAPQWAFVGTDGTVLARVEYDSHSTFHGGGRVLGTTEQGWNLSPGARLLDVNGRPLCDLVYEQPPSMDRPHLPDGRDARTVHWIATDGTRMAQRRDGVLYLDDRVTGTWRMIIIGSYLSIAFEFHLPIGKGKASEAVPEVYRGYADVHTAYDEFQRNFVGEQSRATRTRVAYVFPAGVQRDQLEHLFKLAYCAAVPVALVILIVRFLT